MTEITRHLDPLTIAGLIDGWLEPAELDLASAHLDGCDECVSRLADVVKLGREEEAEERIPGLVELRQEAESILGSPD